jgi:hypothetical protein
MRRARRKGNKTEKEKIRDRIGRRLIRRNKEGKHGAE